jgi:hypothetical protein
MALLLFRSSNMERRTTQPPADQPRREAPPPQAMGPDDHEGPRVEDPEINDRTPEEAGYGYGV